MKQLLGVPAFARLWVAAFFGETAEWMLQVALPVYVFQRTGSAATTALSIVLGLLPAVLLSPVAGVVADRWNRRAVLFGVCCGLAVVAVPLLASPSVTVVYAVMAAQAALASVFEPARNALVPELVGVEEVTGANGLMSVNGSVARLAGGWAGGALLGSGGLSHVMTGYLAVLAVAAALLAKPFRRVSAPAPAAAPEPVVRAWLDGLRELTRNHRLRRTGLALVVTSLAQGMFLVLFVVYVLDVLGGSEADAGLLRGVQAIGGLAAGFALATVARRVAPAALLGWGALALGLLSAVIWNLAAVTTALGVYVGLFVVVGAPGVAVGAGVLSEIQSAVAPERAGRVLSTAFAAIALGTTAGALLAGALVATTGLAVLLNVQAGVYVLAAIIVLARKPPVIRRFREEPATAVVTVEGCRTSSRPATST
ncbi:Predicted arabinose efflux permease, MFS family [Amycolatopsis pretoriensis]|uniref:Predicted arabinose efflux permease, MFS family n=1 Tax=Amycolatopsis pretoriensis TaxID=218821 RepID=A0A1H5Q9Z1_9PSEU|nr:MFS transporter [Amycolatopsis pretoriensis]SEF22218.1 Predicted arabinose efflux permease, MFS family [Amycolatopsis pretoriensis]